MLKINANKVKAAKGFYDSITVKGKARIVISVPADGFERLVAYQNDEGENLWVHQDFRS